MEKHYRLNFVIPLLFVIITVSILMVFLTHTLQENAINKEKIMTVPNFKTLFQKELEREAGVLTGYLDILKKDTHLQSLFLRGDREGLYRAIQPVYEDLNRQIDLTHFYFIRNNGEVFLRGHEKTRYSDIVERYTFLQAKASGKPYYGIEFGIKKNYTLRVVHPWIVNGKTIGFIELGKEVDKLITAISSQLKTEIYLAVDKNIYANAPEFVKKRVADVQSCLDYYIVYATYTVPPNLPQIIKNSDEAKLNFKFDNRYFHAFTTPLIDVSQQHLGEMVFLVDATLEHEIMNNVIKILAIAVILLTLLLFIAGYYFIHKKEQEINTLTGELSDRKEFMETLIETAPVPIFYKDEKGVYLNANKKFLDLFGFSDVNQIKGKTAYDIAPEAMADLYHRKDLEVLDHPKKLQVYESTIEGKNHYDVVFYKSAFFKADGSIAGMIGMIYDITERKKMEQQLQHFNEMLADQIEYEVAARMKAEQEKKAKDDLLLQQSKMAAMGEMIGAIAHQWKQPLNIIGLLAQDLGESYRYGELGEREVNHIEKSIMEQVEFMSQTVNDFREFFKPAKEKKPFLACETVKKVYELIQNQFVKMGITVDIEEHRHFTVYGYPNEFKHVILNILNNARDVFEEKKVHGKIRVSFASTPTEGTIYIRDNGGGIPEAFLPDKLFEPYVSSKGDKGTGIGLQIAKTIIEKNMGGTISAHNIEDGAEFVITLPVHSAENR